MSRRALMVIPAAAMGVAALCGGCGEGSWYTEAEIQMRVQQELDRRLPALRDELRAQLQAESAAAAAVAATNAVKVEHGLRDTSWGMTMDEVIAAEGTGYVKRTDASLVYATYIVDMPSVIKYGFEQGLLAQATVYLCDPRLPAFLPARSEAQLQRDFDRVHALLNSKYGHRKASTTYFDRLKEFESQIGKVDVAIQTYTREREDLERERTRKQTELLREYDAWNNRDEIVQRGLNPIDKKLERNQDWIAELNRQKDDIRVKMRDEEMRRRSQTLPKQVQVRWYREGEYDVILSMVTSPQGNYLSAKYSGYGSPRLATLPADL